MNRYALALAAPFALLLTAAPVFAQDVVEPAEVPATTPVTVADPLALARGAALRGDAAEALSLYLRALSRDARDVEALTGAGRASLELDDPQSAIAFYARAEEVAPRNGRVKAGLGAAMVAQRNPRAALRFFDDAVEQGVSVADIAADRGLAYDLRGDTKRAQADYRLALMQRDDAETVRRLALSQAIAGLRNEALATLDPLLRRQDIPAWRARAFVFAVTGDTAEAEKAAAMVMPRAQAQALGPFLGRIAALKPAGQAAAVHFGYIPRTPSAMASAAPAGGDGFNLVARVRSVWSPSKPTPAPVAAMPQPATTQAVAAPPPTPVVAAAVVPTIAPGVPQGAVTVRAARPLVGAVPGAPPPEVASPPIAIASSKPPTPEPAKAPAARTPAKTAEEPQKAAATKPKPAAKKPAPEPDRHWVQVAGGANVAGLPKAWAAVQKAHPALLKGRDPWTMHYRFTNRIMIGPFKSEDEAQAFVNKAAGSGFSTFAVTTAGTDAVTRLKAD